MAKAPDFHDLLSTLVKVALAAGDMILKGFESARQKQASGANGAVKETFASYVCQPRNLYVNFQELIALSNGCCS